MNNITNRNEEVFTCKINSIFYLIKLYFVKRQINIMITKSSKKDKIDSVYINNYTLSHLQEINSYFKIFNSIKDIYIDLIKIINNKNFLIIQNENETLSFIIEIKINDKKKNISLTLSKKKNGFLKEKNSMKGSNIEDINYELNAIKIRLNALEERNNLQAYPNDNYNVNSTIYRNPNMGYNQLENMINKMNQLENEYNDKSKKIRLLENKINFYQNQNKNYQNYRFKRAPNYSIFINKKKASTNTFLNNSVDSTKKINRKPFDYSIYSDNFEIRNTNNKNNIQKIRRYNSMEKKQYKNNINTYRNNHYKSKINLSTDPNMRNTPSIQYENYKNDIPIVKRENILNLNSRIIFRNKEAILLLKKLSGGDPNTIINLNLLYRASKDGDSQEILKMCCSNKLKTLTLFYTIEGARFGVYIEKYKKKNLISGNHLHEMPGTSFIISLNNLIYYNVLAKKTSLDIKNSNMLCFGLCSRINNNQTNFLIYTSRNNFIGKRYLFGDKNDVYLNLDYKNIVGSNPYYHIKDVEIFEVIFN